MYSGKSLLTFQRQFHLFLPSFLLGVPFDPKDCDGVVIQNIGGLMPGYVVLHHCSEILKSKVK
jgi:hypothetical protein